VVLNNSHDLICDVNFCARAGKLRYGPDEVNDISVFSRISLTSYELHSLFFKWNVVKNFFDVHIFLFSGFQIPLS